MYLGVYFFVLNGNDFLQVCYTQKVLLSLHNLKIFLKENKQKLYQQATLKPNFIFVLLSKVLTHNINTKTVRIKLIIIFQLVWQFC